MQGTYGTQFLSGRIQMQMHAGLASVNSFGPLGMVPSVAAAHRLRHGNFHLGVEARCPDSETFDV